MRNCLYFPCLWSINPDIIIIIIIIIIINPDMRVGASVISQS